MPDPGFYGDDSSLVYVTPDGRIWHVQKPEEGETLRELSELPKGVESFQGRFPPEIEAQHVARVVEAMGDPGGDWPQI
jgi:hypothetical protein